MKILTLGCFDLFHPGHVYFFKQAKQYGDHLTVGIASDALVTEFKGKQRPIFSAFNRLLLLRSCKFVDAAHIYGNDNTTRAENDTVQKELVAHVKPDIFVEGADRQNAVLPNWLEQQGIQRITLPRLSPNISTTAYLARIRENTQHPVDIRAPHPHDISGYYFM